MACPLIYLRRLKKLASSEEMKPWRTWRVWRWFSSPLGDSSNPAGPELHQSHPKVGSKAPCKQYLQIASCNEQELKSLARNKSTWCHKLRPNVACCWAGEVPKDHSPTSWAHFKWSEVLWSNKLKESTLPRVFSHTYIAQKLSIHVIQPQHRHMPRHIPQWPGLLGWPTASSEL